MGKNLICAVFAANGNIVLDDTLDVDGSVYADYKLIVDSVNKNKGEE